MTACRPSTSTMPPMKLAASKVDFFCGAAVGGAGAWVVRVEFDGGAAVAVVLAGGVGALVGPAAVVDAFV